MTQDSGVRLAGADEARDLSTLLSRVRSTDQQAAVRVQALGEVLAVWVPVITPQGLMDPAPTVLGLRVVRLASGSSLDLTVSASSLVDRLARWQSQHSGTDTEPVWLSAPPQEVTAAWAGVLPPRSGWAPTGTVPADTLRDAAAVGIRGVAEAVPTNSGAALVHKVRSRIWGEALGGVHDHLAEVPRGSAFGLDMLGFLPAHVQEVTVARNGPWARLSSPVGHVLARATAG